MRKLLTSAVVLLGIVVAFVAGWLSANPTPATAAPVYRWSAADEAYYAALLEAHTELRTAFGAVFDSVGSGIDDDMVGTVHAAAQTITDLEPTTAMLAADSIALYAASYCASAADFVASAAEDEDGFLFAVAPLLAARDHCSRALADVKIELARIAALNGGFPASEDDAPAPAPTSTKRP